MSDIALAIDAEAVTMTHKTRDADSYNTSGNAVLGAANPDVDIQAAVQPVSGRVLQDLPEGVRSQVNYVLWTRASVNEGDTIGYNGQDYRVLHVWPRPIDGFRKAAIGRQA
jgi:hypothetical protein